MLNWFELDLRSLFREFVVAADHGADAEEEFRRHIRTMESNVIFLLMAVAGLAILLIWPTDWLMFEGRALDAFFRWRTGVLLIVACSLTAMMISTFIRSHAGLVLVVALGLSAFVVCFIFGGTFPGGFATPFFYWTYILPFASCFILSFGFVRRILAILLMVVPAFLGFLLADPSHIEYRYAASPFLVQLGLIPVAVLAGHLVHNLYRRYFFLNRELESSVEERNFLFQELNHRVKNNMQVIMSLLSLRANETEDPEIREQFLSLRRRIRAMAIVHERLYEAEEFSRIDLREYLEDLVEGLAKSQGARAEAVRFELRVDKDKEISLDRAVPLGLIVNELVSNACEHAFVDQEDPIVAIQFQHRGTQRVLEVADNGRGFPDGDPDFEDSFGLNIVRTLVERQLDGRIEFVQDERTVFRITYDAEDSTNRN